MENRPPRPQSNPTNPNNQIAELQKQLDLANSKLQEQEAIINSEKDRMSKLNTEIQDAKNQLNRAKESDNIHIQKLNDLKVKTKQGEALIVNLNAEVTNLQNEINLLADSSNKTSSSYLSATDKTNAKVEGFGTSDGGARIIDLINALKDNNLVLYDAVSSQNYTLDNHLQEKKNTYTTDDQKVYYQLKHNTVLFTLNFYLLITYYAFLILFAYLFHRKNPLMSIYLKLFILFLIAIYPWVISHIEYYAYYSWVFITAVIHGNPV